MAYVQDVIENVINKNPGESEFHQSVIEILESLKKIVEDKKIYKELKILERLTEPDRQIKFRVNWIDKNNEVNVNTGYRVQFNNSLGPYKGGLRFHNSVNISIIKFLAFEQTFKNALTTLPLGGAKGGSDFDPAGKTDIEIMNFCKSFVEELFKYIGANTDIPAGDIGVGAKEIGFLYGHYKKLKNICEGSFTGKSIESDGLLGRKEATGFGLIYFLEEMLNANNMTINGMSACISGSGNVAIYAAQKAIEFGAKVISMSDSTGWIYDEGGIDLDIIKDIKETNQLRIYEYQKRKPDSKYFSGRFSWNLKCDICLPCATQNEILIDDAKEIVKNGCLAVCEGANMPTTIEATKFLMENKVLFGPAKAANAGGVATSGLEMIQNATKSKWSQNDTNDKLLIIMKNIFRNISQTAETYSHKVDYLTGANIYSFDLVSKSIISQGV